MGCSSVGGRTPEMCRGRSIPVVKLNNSWSSHRYYVYSIVRMIIFIYTVYVFAPASTMFLNIGMTIIKSPTHDGAAELASLWFAREMIHFRVAPQ